MMPRGSAHGSPASLQALHCCPGDSRMIDHVSVRAEHQIDADQGGHQDEDGQRQAHAQEIPRLVAAWPCNDQQHRVRTRQQVGIRC